uniref:Uncharacterized protein n=1 Tax=Globisporangium ultimum (strain ATCC 200006 / CBS 805.95 / DAOM BR144) TaxID=431595 RepID=K3WB72_GLOUD
MEFESKSTLEAAIDVCSTRVRELQECVRKNDGGVTLEQVAEQVKKLVALRKELQLWKAKEEEEEEALAAAAEQEKDNQNSDSNSGAAVTAVSPTSSSSGKKKRKKAKKKAASAAAAAEAAQPSTSGDSSNESDEPVKEGSVNTPEVHEEPVQAETPAVEEASLSNQDDETIAALEEELKKAQRTRQAKEFLTAQAKLATAEAEKVESSVAKTSAAETKKADAKKPRSASVSKEHQQKIADLEAQLASEKAKATEADQSGKSAAEERLKKIAALESELASEKSKSEDADKANKQLAESESKLREEKERLVQSIEELKKTNAELVEKIEKAVSSDAALQAEVTKLQSSLKEMEDTKSDNDTNFRKLWKTIDEFQMANNKLQEKNTQLEAEVKSVREEAENSLKERSSHHERSEELASELEKANSDLKASKSQVEALTMEAQKLRDENESLLQKIASVETKFQASSTQISAIEKELAQTKQQLEAAAEQNKVLSAKSDEAATIHEEEKLNLSSLMASLQADNATLLGKSTELEKLFADAKKSTDSDVAEKEAAASLIRSLKDEVVALKLASEKAAEQASGSTIQVKNLTLELGVCKEALTDASKRLEATSGQRGQLEAEAQNLRNLVVTQEDMLKKTRASMLEANEELKEVHKHTQKWKSSAQFANSQLNEKIAEADKAKKQLTKTRAELTSAETARKQLQDSLKEKDKKMGKVAHELQLLREKLAALDKEKAELERQNQSAAAISVKLTQEKTELLKSTEQLQTYRQTLMGLIPLMVAAIFYAVAK